MIKIIRMKHQLLHFLVKMIKDVMQLDTVILKNKVDSVIMLRSVLDKADWELALNNLQITKPKLISKLSQNSLRSSEEILKAPWMLLENISKKLVTLICTTALL